MATKKLFFFFLLYKI